MPVRPDADKGLNAVSIERMRQVYDEVKTPFKYGVVILGEANQLVESPSVFRKDGQWYMVYAASAGNVVVQLYLHDELATIVRPIRELKAFKRVTLEPGESRQVVLTLPYRSFGFSNKDLKFGVEHGEFKIYLGKNAADT